MWYFASMATMSPALSCRSSSVSSSKVAQVRTRCCSFTKAIMTSRLSAEEAGVLSHFRSTKWPGPCVLVFCLLVMSSTACSQFLLLRSLQLSYIVLQPAFFMVLSFVRNHGCFNTVALIQSFKGSVEGSCPNSLNWIKCSASELYPLPLSVRLDRKGHVNASALSSWHIIESFKSVLAVQEDDDPWPSRCTSLKFCDIFYDIVSAILKFQIQILHLEKVWFDTEIILIRLIYFKLFCNNIFITIMATILNIFNSQELCLVDKLN